MLGLTGIVSGDTGVSPDTGSTTNVIFGKMTNVGANYEFQPYLTQYTGTNDWGRYTFVVGTDKLDQGNYSLMQQTPNGWVLVQSYRIEPSGSTTPEYVQMNLEVGKDELPVPLQFTGSPASTVTTLPVQTPVALSTTGNSGPSLTTIVPTTVPAKSPINLSLVIAALGIGGIIFAVLRRR